MKFTAVFAVLVLATSVARAQDVRRIEIAEYGIYAVDKTNCRRDAQGIERCDRTNIRHAATTWNVPAQIGVEFGLRYRVVGAPNGKQVSVKRVWVLPAPGFVSSPTAQPIRRLERVDTTAIGGTTLATYGFDDPWELIPGPWVLEFWSGDRKLDERRFMVAKP